MVQRSPPKIHYNLLGHQSQNFCDLESSCSIPSLIKIHLVIHEKISFKIFRISYIMYYLCTEAIFFHYLRDTDDISRHWRENFLGSLRDIDARMLHTKFGRNPLSHLWDKIISRFKGCKPLWPTSALKWVIFCNFERHWRKNTE